MHKMGLSEIIPFYIRKAIGIVNNYTSKLLLYKVSINTIIINLLLTVLKLCAGILGHSPAVISDAAHSGSDVLSTLVVMLGAKFSSKKPDSKHPYGHEKLESVASIALAAMLFFTAAGIGWYGLKIILHSKSCEVTPPSFCVIWVTVLSVLVKEWMFRYTKKTAVKINSTALLADAWHHRTDAISSVGSFIGVLGAIMGFPLLDPIMSIVICIIIAKISIDICKTAIDQIVDTSASESVENEIRRIVGNHDDIASIDVLKTRLFGNKMYVDIDIKINENMSFSDVHDLIHSINDDIMKSNHSIKHCMIHANPAKINP